jgi:predicted alpha/beta-fold hydrolase
MKKSFCRGLWTGFVILSWGTGASGQEDVGLGPQAGTPPAIASPAFAPPAVPPAPVPTPPPATVPPQAIATADKPAPPEELVLDTTDGLALHVWHYPAKVAEDAKPTATVILLHDIEGSHRSVETLAQALQAAGCDVVAPRDRVAPSICGRSRRPTSN